MNEKPRVAERGASSVVALHNVAPAACFSLYVGTATYAHDYSTMSERAQACRRKASECELAARLSRDVEMRLMYRDLAQLWREMAAEMEQFEQTKQQSK
jgi:hypothetical protein